jgi:hypothetical protein
LRGLKLDDGMAIIIHSTNTCALHATASVGNSNMIRRQTGLMTLSSGAAEDSSFVSCPVPFVRCPFGLRFKIG